MKNAELTKGLEFTVNMIGGNLRKEVLENVANDGLMVTSFDMDAILESSAKKNVRGHFKYLVSLVDDENSPSVTEENILDEITEFGMNVIMRNARHVTRNTSFTAKILEDLEGEAWAQIVESLKSLKRNIARHALKAAGN